MDNNVPLNCSCPKCNQALVVPLNHNADENKVMSAVESMMGNELKLAGSYTYVGEATCPCGNLVIACLTVSAQSI